MECVHLLLMFNQPNHDVWEVLHECRIELKCNLFFDLMRKLAWTLPLVSLLLSLGSYREKCSEHVLAGWEFFGLAECDRVVTFGFKHNVCINGV